LEGVSPDAPLPKVEGHVPVALALSPRATPLEGKSPDAPCMAASKWIAHGPELITIEYTEHTENGFCTGGNGAN